MGEAGLVDAMKTSNFGSIEADRSHHRPTWPGTRSRPTTERNHLKGEDRRRREERQRRLFEMRFLVVETAKSYFLPGGLPGCRRRRRREGPGLPKVPPSRPLGRGAGHLVNAVSG
jgi:hypothetical protein